MSEREATSTRLIAALGIAGLISGVILVGIYEITKPVIADNQARALERAVLQVLPGTERIVPMAAKDGSLAPMPAGSRGDVFAGYGGAGDLVGFAIPAAGPGFMDTVGILYGYDPTRRVIVGMKVLESRETPGLGDKIEKDAHFLSNFEALAVDPGLVAVKPGAKANPNEVDTISGATISSKAVIRILQGGMDTWGKTLDGAAKSYGKEPKS
jgi:electron transport complex protein RnfG